MRTEGAVLLRQQATPSAPAAGRMALYAKTDGLLYAQTPGGIELGPLTPVRQGLFSARPAVGTAGATYMATDTGVLYRDDGAAWRVVGASMYARSATDVAATVKGFASQSANLQEWQNSSAGLLLYVGANGVLNCNQGLGVGGFDVGSEAVGFASGGVPGNRVLTLRGSASQTADLLACQNAGGARLMYVDASGSVITAAGMGAALGITTGAASFVGLTYNGISNPDGITGTSTFVLKGIAGQTASLMDWYNSAGVGLGGVDNAGLVYSRAYHVTGANGGSIKLEPNSGVPAGLTISIPGYLFSPIQAGAYTNASSRRYKEDIEPTVYDGLETLSKLKVVDYDYKPDAHISAEHSTGLIAEDTAEVYPYAVLNDDQGRPDAIDYSRLVPLLIKAVQELTTEVSELRARVASME